jgi:hypothetical protein
MLNQFLSPDETDKDRGHVISGRVILSTAEFKFTFLNHPVESPTPLQSLSLAKCWKILIDNIEEITLEEGRPASRLVKWVDRIFPDYIRF